MLPPRSTRCHGLVAATMVVTPKMKKAELRPLRKRGSSQRLWSKAGTYEGDLICSGMSQHETGRFLARPGRQLGRSWSDAQAEVDFGVSSAHVGVRAAGGSSGAVFHLVPCHRLVAGLGPEDEKPESDTGLDSGGVGRD